MRSSARSRALRGPAAEIAANPDLRDLRVGPASASLTLGGTAASSFELTATTRLRDVTSDLLVAVRPDGRFTVGIKASDSRRSASSCPTPRASTSTCPPPRWCSAARTGRKPVGELTDGEFDFYKTLYGCADDATRGTCASFTGVDLTRGAEAPRRVRHGRRRRADGRRDRHPDGRQRAAGGHDPACSAARDVRAARLARELPLRRAAGLVRPRRRLARDQHRRPVLHRPARRADRARGAGPARATAWCTTRPATTCSTSASRPASRFDPMPASRSAAASRPTRPWRHAFGQELARDQPRRAAARRHARRLGPEVTMGFQGDVKIGTKDIAAALKVGLSPAPAPAFVRPNLIGFSAASNGGRRAQRPRLAQRADHRDAARHRRAAGRLAAQPVPAVLAGDRPRPVPDAGVRFNADLYVGYEPPGGRAGRGRRRTAAARSTSTPRRGRAACDQKAQGCLASVYGRLDNGGVMAGGELNELRARADRAPGLDAGRSRSRRPSSSCG